MVNNLISADAEFVFIVRYIENSVISYSRSGTLATEPPTSVLRYIHYLQSTSINFKSVSLDSFEKAFTNNYLVSQVVFSLTILISLF